MDNLRDIVSTYRGLQEVIYILFCRNDKFYVGHTINLRERMKYGHFGKIHNRVEFLKVNRPLELLHIIETDVSPFDSSFVHRLEDYVTVIVSKKYGAENVFGGFRHLKSSSERIEFVKNYDYSANRKAVEFINSKIDFTLPEISEIKETLFGK